MKRKIVKGLLAVILLTALLGGIEALLFQDIPLLGFCIAAVALFYAALWLSHRLVPREPRTWRRWFAGKFVSVGFVCTAWSALFASLYLFPAFFISTKTTYITEPRLKEWYGKKFYGVDYLAYFDRNIAPEDNAARYIIPVLWDRRGEGWKWFAEKLNIPEDFEPPVQFTSFYDFNTALPEESRTVLSARGHALSEGVPLPYSDEEREILQPWIEGNESAFAFIEEALKKPFYYVPPQYAEAFLLLSEKEVAARADSDSWWDKPSSFPLVSLSDSSFELSLLANYFYKRCLYHLSLGETDKAWHNVRQLQRILELQYPHTEESIDQRLRFQWLMIKAAEAVLRHGNWESDEIRQALQELTDSHRPLADVDVQRILDGERVRLLADFQQNFHCIYIESTPFPLPYPVFPLGRTMVAVNRWFDEIEIDDRGHIANYAKASHGIRLLLWYGLRNGAAVYDGTGRSLNFADCIDTQTAEQKLTQLVFALELYRKEHENRYPPDLETLCNGYVEKVPVDPFSKVGESMIYEVNDDRTGYLVYSIGRNRIDDGGEYDRRWGFGDIWRKWNYETD